MGWEQLSQAHDLIVFQRRNKGYVTRIEARQEEGRWIVFQTFFNGRGLSLTEEFEARSREEAGRVVSVLKQQPPQKLTDLKRRMLAQKKKFDIHIKRSYKEYNVEKWFFGIGKDAAKNCVFLRFFDEVELDFIIDQKYHNQEEQIVEAMTKALGLQNIEEELVINCYYCSKKTTNQDDTTKVVIKFQ